MKRIHLTLAAENDLIEIADYIAQDSISVANRLLDRIEDRCRALAEMPETGVLRAELAPELRSAAVGRYVIFYRHADDGVQIIRVLHGSRDIDNVF